MPSVKLAAIAMSFVMFIAGALLVYRQSSTWGSGSTLQVLGLVLLVPTILILSVTDALSKEIIATLLGGVAGYIFGRSSRDGPGH